MNILEWCNTFTVTVPITKRCPECNGCLKVADNGYFKYYQCQNYFTIKCMWIGSDDLNINILI